MDDFSRENATKIPTSVKRPLEYDDFLKDLVMKHKLFTSYKNALVFSAAIGFQKHSRLSFKKTGEPIKLSIFDDDQDIPFMYALALAEENDINLMRKERFHEVITIFEEYANGGLSFLYESFDPIAGVKLLEQLIKSASQTDTPFDPIDIFNDFT
ncbi:DNA phosphorothioation-associated protein 4 [Vibrio breoganii]